MHLHRASILSSALCLVLAGCASGKSAQPGGTTATAASAEPDVPRDPLQLLVGVPESVVLTRTAELRSAPQFERLRPYVERASCTSLAEWDGLVRATTRSVMASRTEGEREAWLLVLDGSYADADAERVLREAIARTPRTGQPVPITQDRSGRFAISEDDQLAASLLERRLLVVGTRAWVRSALDSIAHPAAKLADSPLWREVATAVRCTEQSLCVLSTANGSGARALGHGLASAGAKNLGQQLVAADSALALSLPAGAELQLRSRLPDAGAADAAQRGLRDLLWQVGLLTRLAGLPDVLTSAQIGVQGSALDAKLSVNESDLARYEERLGQLLAGATSPCNAGGTAAASP